MKTFIAIQFALVVSGFGLGWVTHEKLWRPPVPASLMHDVAATMDAATKELKACNEQRIELFDYYLRNR